MGQLVKIDMKIFITLVIIIYIFYLLNELAKPGLA
jgi:hypothetical protein